MTTDVATQEQPKGSTAVAQYDYGQYAGAGFEGTTAADFKPSFLRVLQGTSPEVEMVEGAKPGLIIDSVTNEVFTEVNFVPAVREHVMVAWKPRTPEGGGGGNGFGGVFQLNDPKVLEACAKVEKFTRGADGKMVLPEINGGEFQLVETIYFHGVQALADGNMVPASLSFYSTGIPVAMDWYTSMRRQMIPGKGVPFPIFAHVTKLGVTKKERGTNRWWVFNTTWANGTAEKSRLAPDSELFKAAVAVRDAFNDGRTKINYEQATNSDGEAGGKSDNKSDAEIPF